MLDGAAAYCVRNSWVIGLGVCIQHHCHYILYAILHGRDMNSLNADNKNMSENYIQLYVKSNSIE